MTKRGTAAILVLLLLLPVAVAAGGVLFAPVFPFSDEDISREQAISAAIGETDVASVKTKADKLSDSDRYIVRFSDDASLSDIKKSLDGIPYKLLAESKSRLFVISPSDKGFLDKYSDIIEYAEPDLVRGTQAVVNDPISIGAYEKMNVYEAWDTASGKQSVTVAVLDTGVDRSHEDLAGVSILPGYDSVAHSSGVNNDSAGHGTAVIGLIAATANNGLGIAGIANGVSILPVKVSSSSTTIYSSDLISGIRFAADAGAKVINMSVGGYSSSYAEQEAVDYAVSKGCILVSASGNGGKLSYADQKSYPASYEGVISVASCNDSGEKSDFSQYNDAVDVAAPGENVTVLGISEGASVYNTDSGTSYSCAFVSGIAALAAGRVDNGVRFGGDEFLALIIDTCGSKRSDTLGHGVINASDIVKIANKPIITGVYDGGVYSESVTVRFNRGTATLDGDPIADGEKVLTNGAHTLTLTDKDFSKTVRFRLNYNPLSYKYSEFSTHVAFEFSRGMAHLDGFPYKSGDKITSSGRHVFTLSDGDEYLEKEFNVQYSLPSVYGIEDGGVYNKPVEINIVGEGNATLDGEAVAHKTTVIKNGTHVLNVTSGNGALSKTYKFTIDFTAAKVFDGDYADATVYADPENGVMVLYGDSLVGIRVYALDSPDKYRHFINTDRVYGHAVDGDSLLLFGDGGITVIDRKLLPEGTSAVVKRFSIDGIDLYSYGNGNIFGFGGGNAYIIDTETETAEAVASAGDNYGAVLHSGNEICLLSDGSDRQIEIFDCETYGLRRINTDVSHIGKSVYFGNGYFAIGNKLYNTANGRLTVEFCADSAVTVLDEKLFTANEIIDIQTGKTLGSFPYPVSDIAWTDDKTYIYGLDGTVVTVNTTAEGMSLYGAAESVKVSVGENEIVNHYRKNMFYGGTAVSAAVSESYVYYLLSESNSLYIVEKSTLNGKTPVDLRYIPSKVVSSDGLVAVSFENINSIYVASESDISDGTYVELSSECSSMVIFNGRIYIVSGGRVIGCSANGSVLSETSVRADRISTDGEYIYVLSGSELSVYNSSFSRVRSGTVSKGEFFVGNAVAVGKTLYDKVTFEKIAVLDSDVTALRGNTVITENRVYSLETNEYIGYTGTDASLSVISEDNTLYSFGEHIISVCSFGNGDELVKMPVITGVSDGEIYIDGVEISYDIGIGHLDGEAFASGSRISSAGKHLLHIVLPCGNGVSVGFTVEEQVSSIEFLVGDRTMSVGETITLRIKYLPEGASSLPVKFSGDSKGLKFGEMGEVTALAVGKYTVKAEVKTDRGTVSTSCVITVRDDLLTFVPESGITVDRDNGFVLGVKAGTHVKTLLSSLYTGKKTAVLNSDGSVEKKYAGTGDRIVLYDADGKIGDELTVVVLGDTDGDSFVSAYDLYVHGRILRGYIYPSEFVKAADLNKNGAIADNDYRELKNIILKRVEFESGTPDQNLFGKCSLQTLSYIETDSYIDVTVCISGCKYARGVMGVIEYGEGLEFVEGYGTGWESDFQDFGKKLSFYSYKEDGSVSGHAFNLVFGMRFKVTAGADKSIKLSSDGIIASFADGTRSVRFEGIESKVKAPNRGELDIIISNASHFKFEADKYEYDITLPYNHALADVSVIRPENYDFSVEGAVIPDNGSGLMIVSITDDKGNRTFYNFNVKRDDEPKFDTNCRLDTLEIEGFRLDPLFNPDITEYRISVPFGTEKIKIYCTAQNKTAEVFIGDTAIYGDGTEITITVGAPDGESLVYTITVTVLPPEPDVSDVSGDESDGNGAVVWITFIILLACAGAITVFVLVRSKKNESSENNEISEEEITDTKESEENENDVM